MTIEKYTQQQQEWFKLKGLCILVQNTKGTERDGHLKRLYEEVREYRQTYKVKFDYRNMPQ